MKININNNLYNSIFEYCKYNNIEDIEKEINRILEIGFNVDKYGTQPFDKFKKEPIEVDKPQEHENKKEEIVVTAKTDESETKQQDVPKPKRRVRIIKN